MQESQRRQKVRTTKNRRQKSEKEKVRRNESQEECREKQSKEQQVESGSTYVHTNVRDQQLSHMTICERSAS